MESISQSWWSLSTFTRIFVIISIAFMFSSQCYEMDYIDNRSLSVQMKEARGAAELGHQIMVRRDAANDLEPGDLVFCYGEYLLVHSHFGMHRYQLRSLKSLFGSIVIDPSDNNDMDPKNFRAVYKKMTDPWRRALAYAVLGIVDEPPQWNYDLK